MIADVTERRSLVHRSWDLAVAAGAGVGVVVRLPLHWTPLGDNALTAMWTDAVGTRVTPLVGGDARFGWNHLGPWLFYLLAVPYRLLGGSPVGLLLGAGVINTVCVLLIVRCVRRVAGDLVGAGVAVGVLLFLITAVGDRLIDPWNPWIAQLPLLLAVVGAWAVLNGWVQWLPWVAAAGSFCVQCHIAFAVPVAVLAVAAVAGTSRAGWSSARTHVRRTAIVFFLAWLPTAVDLVLPYRHNLYKVARWFVQPSSAPTSGMRIGIDVVLHETGLQASWIVGRVGTRPLIDSYDASLGLVPGAGLAVLVLAGVMAWRRRQGVLGTLVALVATLLIAGAIEMSHGRGPLYPYLFGWVAPVGMMCWIAGLLAVRLALPSACGRIITPAVAVASGFVAVLIGVGLRVGLPRSPRERPQDAAIVRQLVVQAESRLTHASVYALVHGNDAYSSIYEHGVTAALRSDGYRIVTDPHAVVLFGRHMIDAHAAEATQITIDSPFESAPADGTVIALSDPLSPAERAREAWLVRRLAAAYLLAGSNDAVALVSEGEGDDVLIAGLVVHDPTLDPLLHELANLRTRGRSIAIITMPPGAS